MIIAFTAPTISQIVKKANELGIKRNLIISLLLAKEDLYVLTYEK